jgi:hypothetical protein
MAEHTRPVPPEQRSPKGPKEERTVVSSDDTHDRAEKSSPDNRGQTGNTRVNTHHQGYQQDR